MKDSLAFTNIIVKTYYNKLYKSLRISKGSIVYL